MAKGAGPLFFDVFWNMLGLFWRIFLYLVAGVIRGLNILLQALSELLESLLQR